MAKFIDLKLKTKDETKSININGVVVNVKQYLPAEDKNAILEIAMQQADQGTILNTFALDAIFHIYLIFKYTDIEFTNEEKSDLFALYDVLESNDIISAVISAIPAEEYSTLHQSLVEMVEDYNKYRNSARALFEQISLFAPDSAEKIAQITQNFDMNKLQQIAELADKTGMNNVIPMKKE